LPRPATLSGWLAYLETLHPKAIALGLERVRAVRALLVSEIRCPVVTVTGTNGKGSTCAMLESILRCAGFSASLTLEFVTVEDFAGKAEWFLLQLDRDTSFVVNQVVLPGKEREAEACRDAIEARGIRWFPQLYKVDGGVAGIVAQDSLQL